MHRLLRHLDVSFRHGSASAAQSTRHGSRVRRVPLAASNFVVNNQESAMQHRTIRIFLLAVAAALVSACSTNPVTGESELSLISTEQEIHQGSQAFAPLRQAQGGDYVADPQVVRYVQSVGERIAAVSERELPYEFVVINDSTPNAWALPGGKIAVNRGLLVNLDNEAQLAAVLSHEIVHAAARHGAHRMQFGMLMDGVLALADVALGSSAYRGLALAGAQVGGGLLGLKYGRDDEREADHHGIRYMQRAGYDPAAAVSLQQTFLRLAQDRAPGWLEGLFSSHPPSQERVDNNRHSAAALGNAGGELGAERYRRGIARLLRTKRAYAAHDEAVEAYEGGDRVRALALLDEAVAIEPEESLFHALRGRIRAAQGDKLRARAHLDHAIALDSGHYRHYVTRGAVLQALGDRDGAQRDFRYSVQLLPTPDAQYQLGLHAMQQGRADEAIGYFREVVAADAPTRHAAFEHLARLDLAANPGRYIEAAVARDSDGYLRVLVRNTSPVSVSGVRVLVGASRILGMRERGDYALDSTLAPGQQASVRTALGPFGNDKVRKYQAVVVQATIAH